MKKAATRTNLTGANILTIPQYTVVINALKNDTIYLYTASKAGKKWSFKAAT